MVTLRSPEEIELLRASNLLVSRTLAEVAKIIRPGVTTVELDRLAEQYLRDHKGIPAFLGYNGFPNTLCTSVNSQVVHGIPSQYILKEGDIISVDCGVELEGYFGDSAYTFAVGEPGEDVEKLMRVTKESLFLGIRQAREGNRIGDMSYAVQKHAEANGFSVVREMVGHGLGTALHEEPEVPNYGRRGTGLKLKQGMCMCVEPMINMGEKSIRQGKDGWTITTRDNQPSAHFELAIAVTRDDPDVLSTFDFIEEALHNKEK